MLTIGQLAAYAGVTARTVRHYHEVGLLPEPQRDHSGYRSYDAAAVVRLIKVRTLAEAGVPLARVHELLAADEPAFADGVADIDADLRAQIRRLTEHRRRIARLAAGDSLALPPEVVDYLTHLRDQGAPAVLVDAERDAWILVAARYPEQMPAFMADKTAQLKDPRTLRFYQLVGELAAVSEEAGEDARVERLLDEAADLLVELVEEAEQTGGLTDQPSDNQLVALLDSFATRSHPRLMGRLQERLREHGWVGWTRIERAPEGG